MEEKKKEKPKPGLKQWFVATYVSNFIGVAISAALLAWLVISVFSITESGASNIAHVQIFFIVFIPVFTLYQSHEMIMNARKELIRGKWEIKEDDVLDTSKPVGNIWRRLLPEAIIFGLIVAVVLAIILPLTKANTVSATMVGIIVFLATFIVSSIVITRHLPKDIGAYTAAIGANKQDKPEAFIPYFLREYAVPLSIIFTIINAWVGYYVFTQETMKSGSIPTANIIVDAIILTVIMTLVVWSSTQTKVRSDNHMGRIPVRTSKPRPALILILIFIVLGIIAGVIVGVILAIAQVQHLTVFQANLIHSLVNIAAVTCGAWLGIWWGSAREYKIAPEKWT